MAFKGVVVAVPSDGSEVLVADDIGTESATAGLAYRNTGTVDLYIGGVGSCVFPLKVGEFIGVAVVSGLLSAKVQSAGTAGEIRALETR